MQAMKCEICGSNDIVKQEGIYVCQHCGTKYTVEEAKKLLGVVKIDQSEENEKYLTLARRAVKNCDITNGIKYWELVAENDPMNWEAIFYLPYFRIELNPGDGELVLPYGYAIDDALDIIHETETGDKRITDAKEVASRVMHSGFTMQHKIIEILGSYTREMLNTPSSASVTMPNVPYNFIFLYSAAKKLREHFPELEEEAKEIEQYANEYKAYPDEIRAQGQNIWQNKFDREKEDFRRQHGGCYIATCVYGSYDCPQVWTLRRFRDNTLAETWYGRAFIRVYYAVSPKLVKAFGTNTWFKHIWQIPLDRLILKLRMKGVSDTPYNDK